MKNPVLRTTFLPERKADSNFGKEGTLKWKRGLKLSVFSYTYLVLPFLCHLSCTLSPSPPSNESIQSARLSFQSSELGPPHLQGSVVPPPFVSKGGDTLACGVWGGRVGDPVPTKGQTLVLYVQYRYYNNPSTALPHCFYLTCSVRFFWVIFCWCKWRTVYIRVSLGGGGIITISCTRIPPYVRVCLWFCSESPVSTVVNLYCFDFFTFYRCIFAEYTSIVILWVVMIIFYESNTNKSNML